MIPNTPLFFENDSLLKKKKAFKKNNIEHLKTK